MTGILWVVLLTIVWMIHIPIVRLSDVKNIEKYRTLRYLAMGTFSWGVLIILQNVFTKGIDVYYVSILIYPTVFFLSVMIFRVIFLFSSCAIPTFIIRLSVAFILINLVIALTNPIHMQYMQIPLDENTTLLDFKDAQPGVFFYIHTGLAYAYLLVAFGHLIGHLYLKRNAMRYRLFFMVIVMSIVFGLAINVIHVFVYTMRLDPTFLFIALVTLALYFIMYKNDSDLALLASRQRYMLSHMREMTLLFNERGERVDASQSIESDLNIKIALIDDLKTFKTLAASQGIVLFETFEALQNETIDPSKRYISQKIQAFPIERLGIEGTLVLLYDETETVKLMHAIDVARRTDTMTETYNRNHFEQSLERFNQDGRINGVIMFDLNHLKRINDALGHHEGDAMIERFVTAMKKATKDRDGEIYRMGGDEFLYVERDATKEVLKTIAETIKTLNSAHPLNALTSFAYGIAIRKAEESFERLIIRADHALYSNKSHQRVDEAAFNEQLENLKAKHTKS